jgi:fumarate reductase flavoprotein subunit
MSSKLLSAGALAMALAAAVLFMPPPAAAIDLATYHAQDLKLPCASCHGEKAPLALNAEESLAVVNQNCLNCHGDAKSLAEKIAPKLAHKEINPHASHLAEIDCVTCHTGHKMSEAYCQNCHTFDLPMPPKAKK